MRAVLDAEPAFAGGVSERWAERPVTRFEGRGVAAGRSITDLTYRRVPSPQ
jgi:tRNA (guanine-N7-)-methyltransferase